MEVRAVLSVIIILVAFTDVVTVFKTKQIGCPSYSNQLANLFSIMCSNIANGTNNTLRDACIGCFQSASSMNNQPSVAAIVDCATTYLVNTNYSTCFNLPNVPPPPVVTTTTIAPTTTPGIDPRLKRSLKTISLNCDTGYCGYVRCIRSVNANILIAGCYAEARVGNNATYPDQQVVLYKNVTACILAKSRCSTMNPITGQTQNGRYTTQIQNKFGLTSTTTYYYTLQIASNGELRIIGLPNTVSVQQDFCSTQNNLMEATWNTFVC